MKEGCGTACGVGNKKRDRPTTGGRYGERAQPVNCTSECGSDTSPSKANKIYVIVPL